MPSDPNRYGNNHRRLRKQLLPHAWGRACVRCGRPMAPGQALDLDHTDDGTSYQGFAHARCNRRAGAIKGNQARHQRSSTPPTPTRDW